MKYSISLVLVAFFIFINMIDIVTPAMAQEDTVLSPEISPIPFIEPDPARPEGAVDCFDYYSFGSVQVDLSPTLGQTISGEKLIFAGKLRNENPYPIVNGQVYVKIFNITEAGDDSVQQNGYPLVDFFVAKDNITLPSNAEQDMVFEWQVPEYAATGEYEATFFFTSAYRYNLLGLSFTDDVTGNKTSFSITSPSGEKPVVFDKNSVTLNGNEFLFAAFPPHFTAAEEVVAKATLVNPSNEERIVEVTWITSVWDGILEANEMKREKVGVILKPRERKTVSYTPPLLDNSVTFLEAVVEDRGALSMLNIRFVRDGNQEVRLNFPSIMSYPLRAGEEATVFSCVHSTNLPIVEGNTLTLTLKDSHGEVIHNYTYEGGITGSMMAVKDTFVPSRTITTFSLTATLSSGGKVVEEVIQTYDCNAIDQIVCAEEASPAVAEETVSNKNTIKTTSILSLGAVVTLILVALGYLVWRRRKNVLDDIDKGPAAGNGDLLMGLLFFATLSISLPMHIVEAKSVTATVNNIPKLYYLGNYAPVYDNDNVPLVTTLPNCSSGCWDYAGLDSGASASVIYKAKLINNSTGSAISDNSSIPVGTQIRIERDTSTEQTDISWNGSGLTYDTPYGRWVTNAGPSSISCRSADHVGTQVIPLGTIKTYVLLNVDPPSTSVVSPSANLSCVGNICTVMSTGTVTLSLNFATTKGKFYYRYHGNAPVGTGSGTYVNGCHANNVAMSQSGSDFFGFGKNITSFPAYSLSIPSKTISFTLTAVAAANNLPVPPTITPQPFSGYTNTSYPFNFQATDPDGDQIYYEVDWNNDSVVDARVPSTVYVNSGTTQSLSNSATLWTTAGTKTFKARTVDSKGGKSGWTNATANISLPPAPTMTTNPATVVADITATLNGLGNPNSFSTTGWFRYSSTNPGTCDDTFGTRVPASSGAALGSGTANVSYGQALTGLTSGTTYYFCAIGSNANGTSVGTVRSFTTTVPPLGVPGGITPVPSCSGTSPQVTVSWNSVTGADYYNVRRSNGGTSLVMTSTNSPYTDTGVSDGTTYTYDVRAIKLSTGELSDYSTAVSVTSSMCAPQPDLVSASVDPVDNSSFTTADNITFIGTVTNNSIASVTQGGWVDLEIDWNNNGGSISDGSSGFDNNYNAFGGLQLGAFTANQVKNLSYTIANPPIGTHKYRFNSDTNNLLTEPNESNNRSAWRTFTVTNPPPSASITGVNCTIPEGDSTCTGSLTWTINYPVSPSIHNLTTGATFSTGASTGTNVPIVLNQGSYVIEARDSGTPLDQTTVTAGCGTGTFWDGSTCVVLPTITIGADPTIIRSGKTSTINVTVDSQTTVSCILYGAEQGVGTPLLPVHSGGPPITTYEVTTRPLSSTQTILVKCTAGTAPYTGETSDQTDIEVIGSYQEI